jgi:hypothetical protein
MSDDRLEKIKALIEQCPVSTRQRLVEELRDWLGRQFPGDGPRPRLVVGGRVDEPRFIPEPPPEPRPRNSPIPPPIMDSEW